MAEHPEGLIEVIQPEVWTVPQDLSFLERGLDTPDQHKLSCWWDVLREEDRALAAGFVRTMWQFHGRTTRHIWQYHPDAEAYGALFVIGSTARGEMGYDDLDFLFITNRHSQHLGDYDPQSVLEEDFLYAIHPTIPEAYRGRVTGGNGRCVASIFPRQMGERKIDLTLQPEAPSVPHWRTEDPDPLVFLYEVHRWNMPPPQP